MSREQEFHDLIEAVREDTIRLCSPTPGGRPRDPDSTLAERIDAFAAALTAPAQAGDGEAETAFWRDVYEQVSYQLFRAKGQDSIRARECAIRDRESREREVTALRRFATPPPSAAPDGFVLVPREPTQEMIDEGAQGMASFQDGSEWPDSWDGAQVITMRRDAAKAYRYMLAAAPSAAPAVVGECQCEPCARNRQRDHSSPFYIEPLRERDTSTPSTEQGLFRKYDVRRTDGSDAPGGKHHGCDYFVLDVSHDPAAPAALAAYAGAIKATHPQLAADMAQRYDLAATPAAPEASTSPQEAVAEVRCIGGVYDVRWLLPVVAVLAHGTKLYTRPTPQPAAGVDVVPVSVALSAVEHVGAANYDSRVAEARRWIREAALAPQATEGWGVKNVEYGLIVSFPDQSETFTLGVEAGMFWQRIESGERRFSLTAHTCNLEVLRRMAGAHNLMLDAWPSEVEGWADVEVFEPEPRPKLQLIRGGLATVTTEAADQGERGGTP